MRLIAVLFSVGLAVVLALPAEASIQVTVTYTADNIVAAFYKDGHAPVPISVGPNAGNWMVADTTTVSLDPGEYSVVFRVKNTGALGEGNPAAFLGQIHGGAGTVYSSAGPASGWQWAFATGPDNSAPDFTTLTWTDATSYGFNGGPNIWTQVLGHAVTGIHTNAQWIWANKNFAEPSGSNGAYDDLWIKGSFTLSSSGDVSAIPEPASLAIWGLAGLGLAGVAALRRRKHSRTGWSEENRQAIFAIIDGKR